MNYFVMVWDLDLEDSAILSEHPHSIKAQASMFQRGMPLKDWMPAKAHYRMSNRYPDRRALIAFQTNTLDLLVVSHEARETLAPQPVQEMEFLPIVILDHRDKVASTDYFILNLLGSVDCMDREKSVYKNSPLNPSVFNSCRKLVLHEDRIPAGTELFRLTNGPTTYIASQELKERVVSRGLQGMKFVPVEQYNSNLY